MLCQASMERISQSSADRAMDRSVADADAQSSRASNSAKNRKEGICTEQCRILMHGAVVGRVASRFYRTCFSDLHKITVQEQTKYESATLYVVSLRSRVA